MKDLLKNIKTKQEPNESGQMTETNSDKYNKIKNLLKKKK